MEDEDIIEWMMGCIHECEQLGPMERLVVFLDEVNTCNSMGLFKEMVCDRSMNGIMLPNNMKLIAACNPYRLKKGIAREEEKMAGLIFDHHAGMFVNVMGTYYIRSVICKVSISSSIFCLFVHVLIHTSSHTCTIIHLVYRHTRRERRNRH